MPKAKDTEQAFLGLTPTQFLALSDTKALALMHAQSAIEWQQAVHALAGLVLGTITYLASLVVCFHLAKLGFPKLAAMALGTPVLTVIKRILDSRI
jgi:hypothetical protein